VKAVDLTGATFSFRNQSKSVGREARRVRCACGRVDHRSFGDHRNVFLAFQRPEVQAHLAFDHVHSLVARIDVKFTAVLAAASDKRERVSMLPQDADALAAGGQLMSVLLQIDDGHRKHKISPEQARRLIQKVAV
jgi:hypothetical protein